MRSTITDITPYNPGLTVEEIEKRIQKPLIKLSSNESLWGASPRVNQALQKLVDKTGIYPDGGSGALKKALAMLWQLPIENFCLGNGADELIFMIPAAFLDPGEEALIPTPTFSEYEIAVKIVGGICKNLSQPNLVYDLEGLMTHQGPKTKLIFICNPNNPTGAYVTQTALEKLLQTLPQDILVVLDEAYCHYANEPDFPVSADLVRKYPNLLILRTFSKIYGLAGLRIGYAVGDARLIKQLEKIRQPFNANSFAQCAALAALEDQTYFNHVLTETLQARAYLIRELELLGLKPLPSQANFILVRIKDAASVCETLLNRGFAVRHTASFGLPEYIRITVGPQQIMADLMKALKEVL